MIIGYIEVKQRYTGKLGKVPRSNIEGKKEPLQVLSICLPWFSELPQMLHEGASS